MKRITLIICALNEGKEPLETIKSIHATADAKLFDIILFDDGSDQWTDIPKKYGVTTIRHNTRKGIHYCRDRGAQLAKTPYLCFLNAHMRFTEGWLDRALKHLDENPKSVLSAVSVVLYNKKELAEVDDNIKLLKGEEKKRAEAAWADLQEKLKRIGDPETIDAKKERKYGANIVLWDATQKLILSPQWRTEPVGEGVHEIPDALGAAYFMSKKWHSYIGGDEGLDSRGMCSYGNNEEAIALKTWAFGGRVLLMGDVEIANLYHPFFKNYQDNVEDFIWNKFFILFTLLDWERAYKILLKLQYTEFSEYESIIKTRVIKHMEYLMSIRQRNRNKTVKDITHLLIIKND